MRVCLAGLGLFGAAFALHWVIWHVRLPRRQLPALLLCFGGTGVAGLALLHTLPALQGLGPTGPWEHVHLLTFYVASALTYAASYTALEEDSPTLCLLLHTWRSGGLTRAKAVDLLAGSSLWRLRVGALVRGGFLVEDGDGYRLTVRGRRMARGFALARRVLGLPEGAG